MLLNQPTFFAAALCSLLCASPLAGASTNRSIQEVEFSDLQLKLTFPELTDFEERPAREEEMQGAYVGKLGETTLEITVWSLPHSDWSYFEPEQITAFVRQGLEQAGSRQHVFRSRETLEGKYGFAPYGSLEIADRLEGTDAVAEFYVFGGVLKDSSYSIEIEAGPKPDDATRAALREFFEKGIDYSGPERDPEWSDEEVEERWRAEFPENLLDQRIRAVRTDHYMIIGDSSGAKAFAKQMEKNYDEIQKQFDFPEIEGRRLMPVFLFRNRQGYIDYMVKATGGEMSQAQAARSAGFAYKDFYATTYESPKDPTHIHEATHQIFRNRLHLGGGGSWFQEGTAEYMETRVDSSSKARIANFGKQAGKKGEFTPFKDFFATQSLLYSNSGQTSKGESAAGAAYTQAGTIMWFVANSKKTKGKVFEYLTAVGASPRSDVEAIEEALKRIYGVDIEGFQEMYVDFWK